MSRVRKLVLVGLTGTAGLATVLASSSGKLDLSSFRAVRFGRAAVAVLAISCDYKLSLWNLDRSSDEYITVQSQVHQRSADRLKLLCEKNGGCFIKAGQHVGALDYLLPEEYVQTMKIFHSEAPGSTLENVYKILEAELGRPVSEVFSSFEETAVGVASLAQVHRAVLRETGETVAVKVQHQQVNEHAIVDMQTIRFLAQAVKWVFPSFQFMWLADEMKKNLPLELDFVQEGKNAEKINEIFSKFTFLKVPRVLWSYTTKRVLTMEYCDGGKVDDIDYILKNNISADEVSRHLGQLYSEMIFVKGYIHCDPHPGNILVRKNGSGSTEIVLLDHGLYQTFSDKFRVEYCRLWQSLISSDVEGIKHYSKVMGVGDMYGLFACMLTGRAWHVVTTKIDAPSTQEEFAEIQQGVGLYMAQITEVLNRVPRQLILIFKTYDLLRCIDSQLKTSATARSYITMSRCCIKAVMHQRLERCNSWIGRLRIYSDAAVAHLRISLYQFYVSQFMISLRSFGLFFTNLWQKSSETEDLSTRLRTNNVSTTFGPGTS